MTYVITLLPVLALGVIGVYFVRRPMHEISALCGLLTLAWLSAVWMMYRLGVLPFVTERSMATALHRAAAVFVASVAPCVITMVLNEIIRSLGAIRTKRG